MYRNKQALANLIHSQFDMFVRLASVSETVLVGTLYGSTGEAATGLRSGTAVLNRYFALESG